LSGDAAKHATGYRPKALSLTRVQHAEPFRSSSPLRLVHRRHHRIKKTNSPVFGGFGFCVVMFDLFAFVSSRHVRAVLCLSLCKQASKQAIAFI
jgi:hypothetical protein